MESILKENIKDNYRNYARGYKMHLRLRKPHNRFTYLYIAIFFSLLAVLFCYFSLGKKILYIWFLACLIVSGFYLYEYFTYIDKYYKKKLGWIYYNLKLTQDGIFVQDALGNNWNISRKWDFYTDAVFISDVIILYQGKDFFGSFFASDFTPEEFVQLKEWIKARIKVVNRN